MPKHGAGKKPAAHVGKGKAKLPTIGVSDDRITTVPKAVQAPKTFILRSLCIVLTDLSGSLTFGGFAGGTYYCGLSKALVASSGWSTVTGLYDEYVLTGFALRFVPWNRYNKLSTATGPVTIVYDVDSATLALSELLCLDYGTAKVISMDDPAELKYSVPNSTTDGRVWLDTAAPPLQGCVSFGTQTPNVLTASTTYGTMYFELCVTARGRR